MGMSQEHAAAAALHAAKMAQLNAMGHSLDKLPTGLLPAQFDLSKLTGGSPVTAGYGQGGGVGGGAGLTIEPIMRRDQQQQQPSSLSPDVNVGHLHANLMAGGRAHGDMDEVDVDADAEGDGDAEIRRDSAEPMDLGLSIEQNNQSGSNNNNEIVHSDAEENYSEDEGVHNT